MSVARSFFRMPGVLILSAILLLGMVQARMPDKGDSRQPSSTIVDFGTWIDANKILMFVTNKGSFAFDNGATLGKSDGLYYPFTGVEDILSGANTLTCIFAGSIWMGAQVAAVHDPSAPAQVGNTLVTSGQHATDWSPGPLDTNGDPPPDAVTNPVYRVYKLYADSLADNPNQDYITWPVDQGAPVDYQGAPVMLGDQMLWAVYNDMDEDAHGNQQGTVRRGLGIEVRQTVWAADEDGNDTLPVDRAIIAEHIGDSPGSVAVEIIDAEALTGHDYMVVFQPDAVLGSTWDLIDITTSTTILSNQTGQSGTAGSPTVDGMQLKVYGGRLGVKSGNMYDQPGDPSAWGWDIPNGTRRFTWAYANGFGWEGFFGALGWGGPGDTHGFGANDPVPASDLVSVLLKLATVDVSGNFDPNDPNVSYAYRYGRGFTSAPARPEFIPFMINTTDGGYRFQDYELSCPLSAWNVTVNPPERLAVGYLENNALLATLDGMYFPPETDSLYAWGTSMTDGSGPREWLWILLDDYTAGTPDPAYQLDATTDPMPVMYWLTVARRGSDVPFSPDSSGQDQFLIIPQTTYFNTPADTFLFTAIDPGTVTTGPEGVCVYLSFKLFNKGPYDLENCFVSIWTDPDLGDASDDLVGCDPETDVHFCYNEGADSKYGSAPPAVGLRILDGPLVPSPGDTAVFGGNPVPDHSNMGMTAFCKYRNGTDPDSPTQSYWYMNGLSDINPGQPLIDPTTGETTKFYGTGDPVTGTGFLDFNSSDRRMMASCGPISFNHGDSQYVLVKLAVGQGQDALSSITKLRELLNAPFDFPTDVDDDYRAALPRTFFLAQNYPNPFNASTVISYSLPKRTEVTVSVYNILGQKVATVVNEVKPAGNHTAYWDGRNKPGTPVASGVYFYRIKAGDFVASKKMVLLK